MVKVSGQWTENSKRLVRDHLAFSDYGGWQTPQGT